MHENAPVLKADRRERTGSRYSRRLRDTGRLPAVVYGHGQEPAHVSVDAKETIKAIHEGDRVFKLELDGGTDIVLLRDVQFNYLG
ncbi:MAG: 50S ribosomal protein L25, partial [Planctomycetota bacterium]